MSRKSWRISFIVLLSVLFSTLAAVNTIFSQSNTINEYPSPTLAVTFYAQWTSNWCGPDVLQSAIQSVNQYNDGAPLSTVVEIIPKATLWATMRDYTCQDIGAGRDNPLMGVVGDGYGDVRKMNIAYDFGVDPHAMAWMMWEATGGKRAYHYWVYYNGVDEATRHLLWTLEKYHEPVIVAAWHGSHFVLVTGYKADTPAYPGPAGTIYQIKVADPWNGTIQWTNYSGTANAWASYWFTPYTSSSDPDPATGWYAYPPEHWQNNLVTIERDAHIEVNPDIGMSLEGYIPTHLGTP